MRVLIAVDGSSGSFAAVSQIGQLLTAGKDEVALYCSPPELRLRAGSSTSPEILSQAKDALCDAIFAEAIKHLPAGLQSPLHRIVGHQDPRHGIVVAAEQWSAHLIVVGARGLGTLERLLLGSVSRAVVHGSKVPVWVARPSAAPKQQGPHVLLACGSPEAGRKPAEMLTHFSWPAGTKCSALAVIPSIFGGRVPDWLQQQARSPDVEKMVQAWAREHDQELEDNRVRMKGFAASLPAPFVGCQPLVAEGEAAAEILATIAKQQIDLVVIGAHQKRSLVATVLGSTSEAVLNHAGCSVLVVPCAEAP